MPHWQRCAALAGARRHLVVDEERGLVSGMYVGLDHDAPSGW
jgi:hypothetical protein